MKKLANSTISQWDNRIVADITAQFVGKTTSTFKHVSRSNDDVPACRYNAIAVTHYLDNPAKEKLAGKFKRTAFYDVITSRYQIVK